MDVDYLMCARRLRGGRFVAEPGALQFLRVPSDAAEPLPAHAVGRGAAAVAGWFDAIRADADGDPSACSISDSGDVLVWVHGYNNTPDQVLARQRQLAADLRAEGWHGVVVGFDWPSDNSTLNYLEDRSDAAAVAEWLVSEGVARLAAGQQRGCATNVHLLGHSTGAYVILEAFAAAQKRGALFKSDWRVGQVAFIAADVSADSLATDSAWAQPMYARIMRLSNYANPFDKVLGVSNAKRLGVSPRAGRVGLGAAAHPKAVNIDCGEHFTSLDPDRQPRFGSFSHSWHIGDRVFARDLAMTLEGGIDRHALPTRRREGDRLLLQDAPRPRFQARW